MNKEKKIPSGYKPSPIGPIPNEWDIIEFGNFAEIQKGKYTPKENEHLKCLELEHFEQGTGHILGWVDSTEQKSTKNVFKKGEVLFGKLRPYLKKYWLAEFEGVCSSEVWVLNAKGVKSSNEFLFRLIQHNHFIQIANVSSGSKMPRADWDYVSTFPFCLPSLPEQTAIANLLSIWDKAIQSTTQLIEQKQNRIKWLMQMLLTGKKRLKGFEKEKWKKYSYENVLKVVKRPIEMHDDELYRLISVRRRSGGIFAREPLLGKQILVKQLRTANEGDFLFSKMQILHGASALVTKEFAGYKISGSYIAAIAKDTNVLNLEFFEWYSRLPLFYHQTYISSYGVHIEKMTFDWDSFMGLSLKLPSAEEQKEIVNVLNTSAKEIKLLQTKLDQLKEQKKGLMQILLTGKKRLNVN